MRKYCLTKCFKRKISKGWDNLLQVVLGMLVLAGIVIAFAIIASAIGWITVYLGMELKEKENYFSRGTLTIVMAAITTWLSYMIFLGGSNLYKYTYAFAKEKYEGEPYKCSIFEVCLEEEDKDYKANLHYFDSPMDNNIKGQ